MTLNIEKLIEKAKEGRNASYSPYSKFKVGSSILLKNGTYITGCNIENISYGLSNCAERTALFKMVSEGYDGKDVVAMAIIGDTSSPISPCGACRQVMAEFLDKDTTIVLANMNNDFEETTVGKLLPYAFEAIENAE